MTAIAHSVKSYLSAIGAAAIYVSVLDRVPKSVGVARDLDRVLGHLRSLMGLPVTFGWIAWAQQSDALLAIAQMPDLMVRRHNGVTVPKTLPEIVETICAAADGSDIALTPHTAVMERAASLAGCVEQVFLELRTSGQMAAFNAAYKIHRQVNGKVQPYWLVQERLRRVTIQALVSSPNRSIVYGTLAELIAKEFPWFKAVSLDSLRKRAGDVA